MIERLGNIFRYPTKAISSKSSQKDKHSKDTYEERHRDEKDGDKKSEQQQAETQLQPTAQQIEDILNFVNSHTFYKDKKLVFELSAKNQKIIVKDHSGHIIQKLEAKALISIHENLKKTDHHEKGGLLNIKC